MTITSVNDGSSDKFYRAWADSADGSKGFSTTDSSKEYFGVYAGTTPPSNYKAYSWTKIKGEAGRSVVDTEMEYAINDSKTTPPTSGWSLEIPVWETGLYIWQRVKVSYSTGNPSYTTPHCLESNIIDDVTGNIGDWIFRDKTDVLSGTEIWTEKADEEGLVHVEVDGKSYQHINLDARNIIPTKFEDWENGDYDLATGEKSNTSGRIRVPWLVKVEPSTTYHWNSGDSNAYFVIRSFNSDGTFNSSWGSVYSTGSRITSSSEHYLGIALFNTSDYETKFNNGTINPLFQLASHSDKSFEEFVPPAPTPDYPIEIHSLNNVDVVSSVGRENLYTGSKNIDHVLGRNTYTIATRLPVGEYIISFDYDIIEENMQIHSFLLYSSTSGSFAQVPIKTGNNSRVFRTFTVTDDMSKGHIWLYAGQGAGHSQANHVVFKDVKIEEGSIATPYSPALKDITESDNHPLIDKINLLLDEPLRSVGDVKDRLFRDTDGLWKVKRNVKEVVLNGTENWTQGSDTLTDVFRYHSSSTTLGDNNRNADIGICSHLKTNSISVSNEEGAVFGMDNKRAYLFLNKAKYPTPESVKNWILNESNKGNPIVLQFRLEIPTTEVLPQPLQDKLNNLRTFKDSNYVYTVLPDKSKILSENLKSTLHATFKSVAWANDFRYKFEQSKAMHATDIWFAKGVSNTIAPNIGWSTDAPVWEDGLYIWSKTITTYGDGRTEETSPVCITGATGRSVSKIEEWYYLSNKSDSLEGGTWSKTPPTWKDGKYIWTKNKIIYKNPGGTEETLPINSTGGSGQKGETGTDARTVRLANVIHAVHFDQDGLMPSVSSIAFPTAVQGFSGVTPYYEFKMGSTIVRGLSTDSSWTLNTSAMKYSDFPLAVTVNVVIGGQTLATDTVTIVGTKPGEDAYTVVLANESHTFVGDVSNAIAGNTTANVIAYRGGTQVGATIGAITGLPTGMTNTIYSNGTTSARVTFTVTTSMKSPNGVVNIPVTVNGKSFTKVFNYAIAFKGAKGDKGTDGLAGKDGVGIKTTVLAYASSTSGTTTPTSGWQTTVPTVAPGNYLWTRTTWTYTDNSVENGYSVSRIGKDGNTGNDGVAGKDGVGIKSTVIHYGGSTSGTSHSGVAWTTAVPSVPNGQFLWTRTTWTYDDNTTEAGYSVAKMGETGAKGDTGPQGVSISKVDVQYYLSTSNTSLTGGSWSTTAPAWVDGRFMWSKTVTTYTSGSPTESKPVCITGAKGSTGGTGSTGAAGRGVSSIVEQFYLSNSKTSQTGGSWSTKMPTWSVGKYIWTRSFITYTTGTPSTSTTEPLVSSEWEAINEIEVGGRNLIVQKTITRGQYITNSNTLVGDSSWFVTDYIPVLGYNKMVTSGYTNLGQSPSVTYYDSSKKFVRGINNNGQSRAKDITINSGEAFIRFSGMIADLPTIKLEKGTIATDWSPAPEDVYQYVDDVEIGGTNLIIRHNEIENSWLNGSEVYPNPTENPTYLASTMKEVIKVNPGEQYAFSKTRTQQAEVYFRFTLLDRQNTFVDRYARAENNFVFTIPDGVYGIWVSYPTSEKVKIEKGNKITGWSPAPEDVQISIEGKADSSATEESLNEAAAKIQVLQQEVEAAATSNELKDFIDKYNKDMASRDKDARDSESSLSSALTSITSIQNNLGDMSETWEFIDRFIKNTPQGIVVGNDSSGSYILIKEDRLSFYSNGQEVAFISQNLMEISRGAFVEQIQIAKYQFEESTTNHLTVRFVG